MNKRWMALLAAATLVPAVPVHADDTGSWIVRGRAVALDSANKDSTGLDLSINNKVIPEVDITYFLGPNLAAELILTYPQSQDVRSAGTKIGTLKHLPPTLTLQYHFTRHGRAALRRRGRQLPRASRAWTSRPPSTPRSARRSTRTASALAFQAGVDIPLGDGWLINVDVKKVQIRTDVFSFGTKAGTFKVDPLLVGIGVGKRF